MAGDKSKGEARHREDTGAAKAKPRHEQVRVQVWAHLARLTLIVRIIGATCSEARARRGEQRERMREGQTEQRQRQRAG